MKKDILTQNDKLKQRLAARRNKREDSVDHTRTTNNSGISVVAVHQPVLSSVGSQKVMQLHSTKHTATPKFTFGQDD